MCTHTHALKHGHSMVNYSNVALVVSGRNPWPKSNIWLYFVCNLRLCWQRQLRCQTSLFSAERGKDMEWDVERFWNVPQCTSGPGLCLSCLYVADQQTWLDTLCLSKQIHTQGTLTLTRTITNKYANTHTFIILQVFLMCLSPYYLTKNSQWNNRKHEEERGKKTREREWGVQEGERGREGEWDWKEWCSENGTWLEKIAQHRVSKLFKVEKGEREREGAKGREKGRKTSVTHTMGGCIGCLVSSRQEERDPRFRECDDNGSSRSSPRTVSSKALPLPHRNPRLSLSLSLSFHTF